jgi:hypothetical protein
MPYFGIVKRAMNRAPGSIDFWWKDHQTTCGRWYMKVHEPDRFSEKTTNQIIKKGKFNQIFVSKKWMTGFIQIS